MGKKATLKNQSWVYLVGAFGVLISLGVALA